MVKKAKDIMTSNVITVPEEATVKEVAKILYENRISGVAVVNSERKIVGVVTEKDLLPLIFSGNAKITKVSEIMTKNIFSFSPETEIDKIALTFSEKGVRRVFIVDQENRVIGVVSRHDVIRLILED